MSPEPVRQINLTDEDLAERLFDQMARDVFAKPLIASRIMAHREGDPESTAWIRRMLGWDA